MATAKMTTQTAPEEVTDRILTAANVISFARLCLIPVYLYLLFAGYDVAAMVVFAVAALTDFLDGQVARRTHTVSKLGKLMDPAIDTLLMMTGVIGTCLIGRCPVWVVVLIIAREAFLLGGGAVLLNRFHIQVPVVYPGKVATTLLFVGFAALLLNWPMVAGLGLTDAPWLPGFTAAPACLGIWSVYAGLILQIAVTIYYCVQASERLKMMRSHHGL